MSPNVRRALGSGFSALGWLFMFSGTAMRMTDKPLGYDAAALALGMGCFWMLAAIREWQIAAHHETTRTK